MKWNEGKNAPDAMSRGASAIHGNIVYLTSGGSLKVYSYQNIHREEIWSQLPDNPNESHGLVVIDGLLTSVGGKSKHFTNMLLSLSYR